MGKFNLGQATTQIASKMNKKDLYVAEDMEWIEKDMAKQLQLVSESLNSINSIINKIVQSEDMSKTSKENLKGWSKKCLSQATSSDKRCELLLKSISEDRNNYKIKLLDKRIEALEKKIASMEG